jgi:hypothetical protein
MDVDMPETVTSRECIKSVDGRDRLHCVPLRLILLTSSLPLQLVFRGRWATFYNDWLWRRVSRILRSIYHMSRDLPLKAGVG